MSLEFSIAPAGAHIAMVSPLFKRAGLIEDELLLIISSFFPRESEAAPSKAVLVLG